MQKLNQKKLKIQKSVKTYAQQSDGSWQFVYVADQNAIDECQKDVDYYQEMIDKYEALLK